MKNWIKTYTIVIAVIASLTAEVQAQSTTGSFSIQIDNTSTVVASSGTGYGSSWYWYPGLQQHIMWFHSEGFDPNKMGSINLSVSIKSENPELPVYFNVGFGWSRELWTNTSAPPLPNSVTSGNENAIFTLRTARTENTGRSYLSSGESVYISRDFEINSFYPEWFYISVSGKNIKVSQNISLSKSELEEQPAGACCNTTNGDCYMTETGTCYWGYVYLGDDTTCESCQISTPATDRDYGDAPSNYEVTYAQNGANHKTVSGMYLGNGVSQESDGKPSVDANADTYDDGVALPYQFTAGTSSTLGITASRLGVINAWFDLNQDGDWSDADEHLIADEPVVAGLNYISVYIPSTAIAGQTFARFRYDSSGGLSPVGYAPDGEVEDYSINMISNNTNPGTDDPGTGDPGTDNPGQTITPVSPAYQLATKWAQPVDVIANNYVYGWNVVTREDSLPLIADDWRNNSVLPIQGFRWWGAFDNWVYASMPTSIPSGFHFGIWSHNPTLNKPNSLVWEYTCTNWSWAYTGQVQDAQGQAGGESVFEFTTLISQNEWFYPGATPNTIYWLSITPIYASSTVSATPWGWMTRQSDGTLAAERILSVYNPTQWPPVLGSTYASGSSIMYPSSTSWDTAFDIITSQPGGGSSSGGASSDLANAIGDLNDDGKIDINDLYILLGFVLNP